MTLVLRALSFWAVSATILTGAAPAQDSGTVLSPLDRARILLDLGRVDQAIALLRARVAANPSDARTQSDLGSAYYLARRPAEAMIAWRQAIALDPGNVVTHMNLGNAFTDAGQFDSAIAEHRRVIALDSTRPTGYIDLGTALERKGLLDEAVVEWKHAVAIDPNSAIAWYNLGATTARQRKWRDALDDLIRAVDINEWYPDLFDLLRALSKDASHDLERGIRDAPTNPMAHYYLAYALSFRHDWTKAMSEIDQAIALDPSNPAFYKARGWFSSRQGHDEEAVRSYERCIVADSTSWACYNLLGWSYNALGEPNRARDALLAAAHINPNALAIQENLMNANEMSDRWAEAVAAGERALALGSTYPVARFDLAIAYFNLKRYDLAWWHGRIAERMGSTAARDFIRDLQRYSPEPNW